MGELKYETGIYRRHEGCFNTFLNTSEGRNLHGSNTTIDIEVRGINDQGISVMGADLKNIPTPDHTSIVEQDDTHTIQALVEIDSDHLLLPRTNETNNLSTHIAQIALAHINALPIDTSHLTEIEIHHRELERKFIPWTSHAINIEGNKIGNTTDRLDSWDLPEPENQTRLSTVTKLNANHRLQDEGKCNNFHGHTYFFRITIDNLLNTNSLSAEKRKAIIKIIKETLNRYQKTIFVYQEDRKLINMTKKLQLDTSLIQTPSSMENLSLLLVQEITTKLSEQGFSFEGINIRGELAETKNQGAITTAKIID